MDRLIPYVSCAQRSEHLKYCFQNFFNEADKIKTEIDPNAKNVLKVPGAHITVPSKMVDLPKKNKRNHCCKICGQAGHYACTCKFKNKKNNWLNNHQPIKFSFAISIFMKY